jgi:amino acid adenylation domain-containing protein
MLHAGFLRSAELMPDRPALHVNGRLVTYAELRDDAASLAATLQKGASTQAPRLTAVFAERSRTAFAGILGALLAGHGYVPLNVRFPIARTRQMLVRAGCASLIVDATAEPQLELLLDGFDRSLSLILPDRDNVGPLTRRWPQHMFVGREDFQASADWSERASSPRDLAYLLFTSGTTGVPKGVGVTHANVTHFVDTMVERYGIDANDRLSQMFDTTFDPSVFDMFVAWHQGSCVFCPTRTAVLNPDAFIREHALTVWFSVPTVALLMQRFGSLRPGRYPSLRWSLFCGEPLTTELAHAWTAAAPGAVLENLYGPTELTVVCMGYRWDPESSPAECLGGLVPIGAPLRGMRTRVVDSQLADVEPGETGELLVAGAQRASGYWRDGAATQRAFVRLDDDADIFYRTGDRVRRPVGDAPMCDVGRLDHQIKVLGHRVELEEIELVLRQEPGVHQAAAVGWPPDGAGTAGIAAFVTGTDLDIAAIRARVGQKLQSYAVPQTIRVLAALPLNGNGKVDRQALLRLLSA